MPSIFTPDAPGVVSASVENPKRVSITKLDGEVVVTDAREDVPFDGRTDLRVVVYHPGDHNPVAEPIDDFKKARKAKK